MPSDAEDLRLLKGCLGGAPGSWEAFVRRFDPYLAKVCRRVLGTGSGQEARDLVQETFLCLLEKDMQALRAYRGEAGLPTYLAAVAVRRVLQRERSRDLVPQRLEASPEPLSRQPEPSAALESRELQERLAVETARLPPQARLALALQGQGATAREIGLAIGISGVAAAKLLVRAKARLRERLREKR